MSSLSEVYEREVGSVQPLRQIYLGAGLLAAGTLAIVAAIVVATTGLPPGYETQPSRQLAGTLAGIGVHAMLLGIFAVLPARRTVRAAAGIGSVIALFAVIRFRDAYPYHWAGFGDDLTFQITVIYSLGTLLTLGCLFVGIANFKRRNDPGGTVTLDVDSEESETPPEPASTVAEQSSAPATDSDAPSDASYGGIGVAGPATPDRSETQRAPTSDGGSTTDVLSSPETPGVGVDAPDDGPRSDPGPVDQYCGNCEHFKYVRDSNGMQPYCALDGTAMEDMDACEEWTPNR